MVTRLTNFVLVNRFSLRSGSCWLPVRSRRLKRPLKLLVIVLSCCLIFYCDLFKKKSEEKARGASVFFTTESCENFSGEEENSANTSEEGKKCRLTVSIWRDLCGGDVKVLRNSPFYPSYPSEKKIIREFSVFQIEDSQAEYGQTIAGFLNPARSGSYRFAIASDDSSELWLSPSENPDEKQLIARVFAESATGKYPLKWIKEWVYLYFGGGGRI